MPQVPMLVELIGGARRVLSADPAGSVEAIAGALADQLDLSLTDDAGAPVAWRFFAPKAGGGFGPADKNANLSEVAELMRAAQAGGEDAGFAGPGEHEGAAYLFRVRLFVPKAVPPPPPPPPEPMAADDEALDLTNMDEEDALETVRRVDPPVRKKRRRRKTGSHPVVDPEGRKRKRKTGGPPASAGGDRPAGRNTGRIPVAETPTRLAPGRGLQEDATELAADLPPPSAVPPLEPRALSEKVETPALKLEAPSPGDRPITHNGPAPTSEEEPTQAVAGDKLFAETRVLARSDLPDDDELPSAAADRPASIGDRPSAPAAPADPSAAKASADDAQASGSSKARRSKPGGRPGRTGGIPTGAPGSSGGKTGRSGAIPKEGRSTGVPKKGRSTGIPKKGRSTGIPGGAAATGNRGASRAARDGGSMLSLGVAVLILLGVLGAMAWVLSRPGPPPPELPPSAPAAPARPWLADRNEINAFPGLASDDPLSAVLVRYGDVDLGPGPNADQVGLLARLADEAGQLCDGGERADGCVVASRLRFAAFRGCRTAGCSRETSQAYFLGAIEAADAALAQVKALPADQQGAYTARVALQSVRLGGQSPRLLEARAPALLTLATKSCAKPPLDSTAECAEITP